MSEKDELLEEITGRLKQMFVDDYDKVKSAKDNVNTYLESIDVEGRYDYNEFCNRFLEISDKLINSLSMDEIRGINAPYIMGEVLSIMVKYKIMDGDDTDDDKLQKIIQHELRLKDVRGNS